MILAATLLSSCTGRAKPPTSLAGNGDAAPDTMQPEVGQDGLRPDLAKRRVAVQVTPDGKLRREIIASDVFGEHLVRTIETRGATGTTWQLDALTGTEEDLTRRGLVPPTLFRQLDAQGGQARGVGGVAYRDSNGLYSVRITYQERLPRHHLVGILRTPAGDVQIVASLDRNSVLRPSIAIGTYDALVASHVTTPDALNVTRERVDANSRKGSTDAEILTFHFPVTE
jgi:hypothetical protein